MGTIRTKNEGVDYFLKGITSLAKKELCIVYAGHLHKDLRDVFYVVIDSAGEHQKYLTIKIMREIYL